MTKNYHPITTAICPRGSSEAIAWCLAWGEGREPQFDLSVLQQMRQALKKGEEVPEVVRDIVEEVKELDILEFPETLDDLKQLTEKHPLLWNSKIGLVYGGATKIKQYVFEASNLPDIRGASALLDRINLVDLPAFFGCENDDNYPNCQQAKDYCEQYVREKWLNKPENFPKIAKVLIPELIIYSTGGNILAFCPAAFVDELANAIEKRYTTETLTANSCAVGDTFRLLEIRFGLLRDNIAETFWLEKYRQHYKDELVEACFGKHKHEQDAIAAFKERKSFNELTTKLAILFNQRRSGNDSENRPSRRYPAMFETHPYLRRDEGDRRSAVFQAKSDPNNDYKGLPGEPWFSEASMRKRLMGQISKKELPASGQLPTWWTDSRLGWDFSTPENLEPEIVASWVNKFEGFLLRESHNNHAISSNYYSGVRESVVEEARSVREIADASLVKGFVAYIYADGNNMGGYIQKEIKNPEDYQRFSRNIFEATEKSVYVALAQHLKPHKYKPDAQSNRNKKEEVWIHPFEIITIGGDDVMLIVPADKALAIAKTIGEEFEHRLVKSPEYQIPERCFNHRFSPKEALPDQCQLSMSTGVLITAENTPIYYAEKLTNQLLKSAKKRAKKLKESGYCGGTVDFLTMKAVTMISSNIEEFRKQALTKDRGATLKLYAAPYTLHELGGLLKAVAALKQANFPKSQLYQIRSFLEQGKRTASLNYYYFRFRLKKGQAILKHDFEEAWCKAKTNEGNIAPWMHDSGEMDNPDAPEAFYETIWRDMVDLYDFIATPETELSQISSTESKS